MANPTGLRNASSILSKMQYNPIRQRQLKEYEMAEGADNRAVSQRDRFLGKQVASEQARLMELDEIGDRLAMRRDKLGFAKKVHTERMSMAEEQFKHKQLMTGLEIPIGIAATGTNLYGRYKQHQNNKKYAAEIKSLQKMVMKSIGKPAGYWQDDDEYIVNYDY